MNLKNIVLLSMVIFFASCKTAKTRNLGTHPSIQITAVRTDTLAIRALEYDQEKFYYSGARNNYGTVSEKTGLNEHDRFPNTYTPLEFRSLAVTSKAAFYMSAGSPALLYKVNHTSKIPELVYENKDSRIFFDSMKFWNDQEGIVIGDPIENCFTVMKTYDGGTSFEVLDCSVFPEYIKGESAFAASNSNIILKGDNVWIALGGSKARVLYSPNRGVNWSVYDTPIESGGTMTGIFAMDFYDENLGVIIGGNWEKQTDNTRSKAITRDGGRTWTLLASGQDPGYCSDITFVPQTRGKQLLATGSRGIWWSGDTGDSWVKLSDQSAYTVVMKNKREGMIAGRNILAHIVLDEQ